ncbi:MAG TPA: hypothetical protein VGQ44_00860 [Gemmatimonadaceae bacterium]|jgi:hypothetical protein|nr:hypothetical protein [Gemmatimonadaceae bacterium]
MLTHALLAGSLFAHAGAYQGPVELASVSRADSVHLRRSAESAQRSFESFRRSRFPVRGGDGGGPCDVRVGRYCYWRGDDADEAPPPEDPPEIKSRRDALITQLDSASGRLSGDSWIAGQLVRYFVDAHRTDDAIRFATTRCSAGRAWCAALAGFAAHADKRYVVADSAFGVALAAMELPERCRWLDITDLLDGPLADRFDHMPCEARDSLARQILTLGAPLYSVSTTDLLTEHLTRYARAKIAEHSATADGEAWGDDVKHLVMRYGWPQWYSRGFPSMMLETRMSITGHDAGMPYDFIPSEHAVDHEAEITSEDWTLDNRLARTGYAPAYARSMHDLPSQIARFRRGDSTLIVAAWDARRDTTLIGRPLLASLVVAGDGSPMAVTKQDSAAATGRLVCVARADSGVVSLELLADHDRRAARRREGFTALDGRAVALSDLLLYKADASANADFVTARDNALASTEIPLARAVGVYWEAYGLRERGEPVHYTVSVQQVGVSWLRRAIEHAHLADPTTGLRLQWDEVPEQHDGVAARGVRVDLSRLRSGTYELAVTAQTDRGITTTKREIVVR